MEIDCFLSQVVGAVDSLLYLINSRLDLGVRENHVTFQDVQSALSAKTKQIGLLAELDQARQSGNWYSLLSELRNQSMHNSFLKKMVEVQALTPIMEWPQDRIEAIIGALAGERERRFRLKLDKH